MTGIVQDYYTEFLPLVLRNCSTSRKASMYRKTRGTDKVVGRETDFGVLYLSYAKMGIDFTRSTITIDVRFNKDNTGYA